MKVLTLGHKYELANLEEGSPAQHIQFIEKERADPASSEMVTVNNGTTNEEVISVLIDRIQHLNAKFPCRENAIAITKLEEALMWLEKRTSDRKKRGVEGKHVN